MYLNKIGGFISFYLFIWACWNDSDFFFSFNENSLTSWALILFIIFRGVKNWNVQWLTLLSFFHASRRCHKQNLHFAWLRFDRCKSLIIYGPSSVFFFWILHSTIVWKNKIFWDIQLNAILWSSCFYLQGYFCKCSFSFISIFYSEPAFPQNVESSITPEGVQVTWDPLEGFAEEIVLEFVTNNKRNVRSHFYVTEIIFVKQN